MPTYQVTDPDTGVTLRLTGDTPPTDEELEEIFASHTPQQSIEQTSTPQVVDEQSLQSTGADFINSIAEPAAAIASSGAADIPAGLAGLATMAVPHSLPGMISKALGYEVDETTASNVVKAIQEAFSFTPKTDSGKQGMQTVSDTLEPVGAYIKGKEQQLGEDTRLITGSDGAAALATTIPTMIMNGLAPGSGKALTGAAQLGKKTIGLIDEVGMFEEAAKFSTTKFDKRARRDMAENLMDEGITLDGAGLDRIDNIIFNTNKQIDDIISTADKGDVRIPKVAVLKDIEKLRKDVTGQLDGGKDRAIIDKIVDDFIDEIKITDSNFTLAKLQEFKKKAYKKITNWNPDKSNKDKMKDRVYKNISLVGKGIIESIVPKTKVLNARQGRLIEAKKPVGQSANRIDNLNKIGLDALIKPASFELVTSMIGMQGVGTAAGVVAHILGRPKLKVKIASRLHKIRKSNPQISDANLLKAFIVTYPAADSVRAGDR